MKLWKSKKSAATSCVKNLSGNNSKNYKDDDDKSETISAASTATPTNQIQIVNGLHQGRALSPAQSEDSGLAADRGTTYATISIPRQNAQSMGIVFADRADVSYPPIIETINLLEPSADFLAPGDRIQQVDGISTIGLSNEQVMSLLLYNRDENAVIEIEYSLPDYLSQNTLCVTTKIAQVVVERENGCLGLTLRGGSELPIIVTNVRAFGPAYKSSRIKPGDRVLRVDNISLTHKSLTEAQQILKCGHNNPFCNLTIEYEVSVMQGVEFSLGPLLIEIERSMNEQMGIVLCNFMPLSSDFNRSMDAIQPTGIYISSLIPASIADRCGALSIGDQILTVDETSMDGSFSPDDVMQLLDFNCTKGFTQIQILPAQAIIRKKGLNCTSPKLSGYNTVDPRRTPKMSQQHKKFFRKSSLPLENNLLQLSTKTRTERFAVFLDCTHGSGLSLNVTPLLGSGFAVTKILPDSVAERCGCIQKGDRVIAVNKLFNLDIQLMRQILRDTQLNFQQQLQQNSGAHWVEIEMEFDMIVDEATRGIFNIKLMKTSRNAGLGVTVNGSSHGAFVISDIKPGSPAHRASVKVGDMLLAIDSHPIQHFNIDVLLKENKNDCITLTIKRNSMNDYMYENQCRQNVTYANYDVIANNFNGFGNGNNGIMQSNEAQNMKYFEEPHYSVVPAPRYWNTLKPNKIEQNQEETMGSSISATDLVNYNNIDYAAAQKMMSLSIGPHNVSHSTQTEESDPLSALLNQNQMTSSAFMELPNIFNVNLQSNGGPLGITLAGSEDGMKSIVISGIAENGIAANTGKIQVGDVLLAINNESVVAVPLSRATKLLQNHNDVIELRLSRNKSSNNNNAMTTSTHTPNDKLPQALYAEVQRRQPMSLMQKVDAISNSTNSSRSGSNNSDGQSLKTIHVTLYKDQVYDDYGFSVSDGLYERGVYINRIRSNGPADQVSALKPYDRIIQVNGTKTTDFDCCLTVPLIAASGDKINLIVQRGILE